METLYLKAGEKGTAEKAAEILKKGGTVAIPTETVYGLAANALDPSAVKKIFEAKGRPQDNPLIVHISSLEEVEPLVEKVDERLYALAEKYWPGPLTVIMKKSSLIPDEVCAGLDTVAIRMPSNEMARAIIKQCGFPLAAPSANTSGKPSPTRAEHVRSDLDGKIDAVVDGGKCEVGVESTVITLALEPPMLLRPGGITPEQLEDVLGEISLSPAVLNKLADGEKPQSPGMKYKHYAPEVPVTIIKSDFETFEKFLKAHNEKICAVCFEGEGKNFEHYIEYGKSGDSSTQAAELFDALRKVDETGCSRAFVRCPNPEGVGLAVYNRLLRSAAFKVLDLDFNIPVYGLTGQTGSGKTTVGELLEKYGCKVIDTDKIAHSVLEIPTVIKALCDEFGEDILQSGKINRRALASRAFENEDSTLKLNEITHPEITLITLKEIRQAEDGGFKSAVIDAPVLFESPLKTLCKKVICVTAGSDTRLKRIIARDGISIEEAKKRMNAQKSSEYYIENSDIVIENDDIEQTKLQIEKLFRERLI